MSTERLRQRWADVLASFWLRPSAMTVGAVILAEALVQAEGALALPATFEAWLYAGGMAGARGVLSTVAAAAIGVAGTTFSITVAALTLASNQMGPRLLRNFTRDPGNQYVLGAFVATFAYALVALRSVHEAAQEPFVPQLAVTGALLLAFACVGALIWFLHHVASSISVDRVVALVARDLEAALARPAGDDEPHPESLAAEAAVAPLCAPSDRSGYLRVLDDHALGDWAAQHDAVLDLRIHPGGFVFPRGVIGVVSPPGRRREAEAALGTAMSLGDSRNVEQDPEFAVRQLVEIGLRALPPGNVDLFTAIAVLDRLGAALCGLAGRALPLGCIVKDGTLRLRRPAADYAGLTDAMFHMLRQSATSQPAVMIRLVEVLGEVGAVEGDTLRRHALRRHLDLALAAGLAGTHDAAALDTIRARGAVVAAQLSDPAWRPGAG